MRTRKGPTCFNKNCEFAILIYYSNLQVSFEFTSFTIGTTKKLTFEKILNFPLIKFIFMMAILAVWFSRVNLQSKAINDEHPVRFVKKDNDRAWALFCFYY